jgi:glycosyltransferase involved in cell wall biosynthesis
VNITCISTSTIPSDTANSIQVMKACQAMARLGHAVHLLVPGDGNSSNQTSARWEELADRYGLATRFDITWLPARPRLKRNDFAWAAIWRARRLGADLVYTWTGQSAVFGLLSGLAVAFEVHDLPAGRLGPLWVRAFLRLNGRKRVLPITRALLSKLEGIYGRIPAEQVVISPNGVDLEQYVDMPESAVARQELGLPTATTVLCAGHLYAGRGVDLFLGLARRFPQASFVWVGGRAEDVEAFRRQAAADGQANVTFTGFIHQCRLPYYQAAADVLLMPYARMIAGSSGGNSAEICSPMKMFDYLAAGRAILSSDLPVIHEVLNKQNALFAQPEHLEGWSAALGRLLEDEVLRQQLATQARRDAVGYSWQARAARALDGFQA